MIAWTDCTTYSRGDTKKNPTVFSLSFPSGLRLVITNSHIYYKGGWVMHCHNVGIDTHPLNVKTQKEAETKALAIVRRKIKIWQEDMVEKT
jgi:hypothetical protein